MGFFSYCSGYYSLSLPQKQINFVGVLPEGDNQQSTEAGAAPAQNEWGGTNESFVGRLNQNIDQA